MSEENITKNSNGASECIFCKIVSGVIPANKVYEDDDFVSFLDIHPVEVGHALLIPKAHYQWMTDAPNEVISKIFILAKEMMSKMKNELPCDYVQLSIVGKDVPHFHIHLIPKKL